MFPCFLLLRGSKTVFLSSPTSHNALHWEISLFSQQLFFPCSPFREPIWGIEAIKPAENEKIFLWAVQKKKNQFSGYNSLLNLTILLFLTHVFVSASKKLFLSSNNFLQTQTTLLLQSQCTTEWPFLETMSWSKSRVPVCTVPFETNVLVWMASAGPEANVQTAIQDNGRVNRTGV